MGVRIIEDNEGHAALYDSVTDVAFGPVFYDMDEEEIGEDVGAGAIAETFLRHLNRDARTLSHAEIMLEYGRFRDLLELKGWNEVAFEEVS